MAWFLSIRTDRDYQIPFVPLWDLDQTHREEFWVYRLSLPVRTSSWLLRDGKFSCPKPIQWPIVMTFTAVRHASPNLATFKRCTMRAGCKWSVGWISLFWAQICKILLQMFRGCDGYFELSSIRPIILVCWSFNQSYQYLHISQPGKWRDIKHMEGPL